MLRSVFHGSPGWNWISSHARTTNGRAAYLAVKSHYLGKAFQSRIRAAADKILDNTFFDGKARTFTFERYCERLNHAFTDLEQSGETVESSFGGSLIRPLKLRKIKCLQHQTYVQLLKLPSITLPNLLTESPQLILTDLKI
jgi:hypothetical protein